MKNTIVIVDDTQLYQAMLKSSVEKLGFDTLLCNDGVQAIKCLEQHNASVAAVFLDIYMPQIDGISTLGHFRSNYPDLPVFMITSSEDAADKKSADGLGAAGFIKKPFAAETIHETIKALLGNLRPPAKRAAG
jgi:CheY-like chemotaxis protein